ncbi:MAG: multidrug efflux RND transporter permease subunit [Endomicrobia bacterium]|nr:multidrug efflux RND transporter permease subunit [Endomicrobiia bacterium]
MFSKFFIERPIFATVISLVIFIAGIIAMRSLPIEQYPDLTPPSISVQAQYPGASAEIIAETVATPLENQINGVQDLIYMNSVSDSNGYLNLMVYFNIGTNPDMAMINVNNRVQAAMNLLPEEVRKYGVSVNKKSSTMLQLMAFTSPNNTYDLVYIANYVLINIIDELKRIEGVGDATLMSKSDYAVRIWLRPDKLKQFNLTPADVYSAVAEQNRQRAAGKIGQPPVTVEVDRTYSIIAQSRFSTPEEFKNIIIRANPDGTTLKLSDVARVELGAMSYDIESRKNGVPAMAVAVYLSPGANAIKTADGINKRMAELAEKFPADLEHSVVQDSTVFVRESINEVMHTLFEAIILVFLVVFLFLKSWRPTLIPCIAVPISIAGAFAGMMIMGFSINTLTLFGIILAIGIVVDDAIVVVENVYRIMEEEKLPVKEATIKAMEEVSGPVVAIVLVLCAVFVPIAFMGGFTGVMYKQFAITIACSVVVSGIVALTLTPALCAMLLKPEEKKEKGFFAAFDRMFEKITNFYTGKVAYFVRHITTAIVVVLIIWLAAGFMFKKVPGALLPVEDQGYIMAAVMADPAAPVSKTREIVRKVEEIVSSIPGVKEELNFSGFDIISGAAQSNSGGFFIRLDPWSERKGIRKSARGIIYQIALRTSKEIPEAYVMPFNPPAIMGLSTTGGLEGYIQSKGGGSLKDLALKTQEVIKELSARPELTGVRTTFNVATPKYKMKVDTVNAHAKGVTLDNLYATMAATFGQTYINDFTKSNRSFKVMMQADGDFRARPEHLSEIFVRSSKGNMIPLSNLAVLEKTSGPDMVEHFNSFPSAKILANPATGYSSGQAIKAVEEVCAKVLGADYALAWTGSTYQEKLSSSSASSALILGIIFVFLILAAQYEKWSLPLAVLSALPFAVFGALLGIMVRGLPNDIYFQVALITLVGLAAKNAILIVEFASELNVKHGLSYEEAAVKASKMRFRPIIMTSLAFICGCIPLAISSGAGAASRHAIGTAVVAGMLGATLIAPFFIPYFFALILKLADKLSFKKAAR